MSEPVREVLAVAGVLDHGAGRDIDGLAGDPGRDGVDTGLLRLLHDVVHLLSSVAGSPKATVRVMSAW